MSDPVRYIVKLVISAVVIVVASELAKQKTWYGALLISLPTVSFLGIIWLYLDTRDTRQVADLSWDILWLVIPSLSLFVALPLLLKKMSFTPALALSTLIMFACYAATLWIVTQFGQSAASE